MNSFREFVQLPERQLVDVTLKFSNGIKREGLYGSYLVYTVLHDGKEKSLKVTDRMEKQFRSHNVQAGEIISLLKETITPKNGGEPFTVINLMDQKKGTIPIVIQSPTGKTVAEELLKPQSNVGNPSCIVESPLKSPEGFSGDTAVMHQSLMDAIDIVHTIDGVEWRATDVEKIGVTLFLSRTGQLSNENVISIGNGNGNGKRIKRLKKSAAENVVEVSQPLGPVAAELVPEKNDLPF